jgi:hypothetical protein
MLTRAAMNGADVFGRLGSAGRFLIWLAIGSCVAGQVFGWSKLKRPNFFLCVSQKTGIEPLGGTPPSFLVDKTEPVKPPHGPCWCAKTSLDKQMTEYCRRMQFHLQDWITRNNQVFRFLVDALNYHHIPQWDHRNLRNAWWWSEE